MTHKQKQLNFLSQIKKHLEEKVQRELIEIQNKREQETEHLKNLVQVSESAMEQNGQTIKANARDLQNNQAYLRSLSHQIREQEEFIETIGDQEDDKRIELTEKTKSKKIIEKLDEKITNEVNLENERFLQHQIDVLAQRMKFLA